MLQEFGEEMKQEMKNVHKEIDDKFQVSLKIVSELQNSVDFHIGTLKEDKRKCEDRSKNIQIELDVEIKEFDKKLKLLEKLDKKQNLLFYSFRRNTMEMFMEP